MERSKEETVSKDPPAIIELKELLKSSKYEVVTDKGKVLPSKTEVFNKLSQDMSESLRKKPKNIYTIILEDRYNILKEILEARNITLHDNSAILNSSLNSTLGTVIEFQVDLTEVWADMVPETVNYDFQSRGIRGLQKLKRHSWTDALYDAITAQTKLPCAVNFKTNEMSDSGLYLQVFGECPDCRAEFRGIIANPPAEGKPIIMECYINAFDRSVKHTTKRQLKGHRRQRIAKELIDGNMLPCIWKRKKANDEIENIGDDEPANISRNQVISKAVVEMRDKILGLISTHDVFESLQAMKFDSRYETSIHSIGFFEFFVHYWTKEQVAVYTKFHDTLYIDGTGSVVQKIKRLSGYSPHIYLYQVVTQVNDKTVPVCQQLSADQHTDAIAKWLFEFSRKGAKETSSFPLPREVVTDFDKALLGGIARAFAQQSSLKNYLSSCFQFLTDQTPEPPVCILRLDICHYMNMVAKWKCYNGTPFGAKTMCLRAMAVLRSQETLEALKDVAEQIFLLVLSRNADTGSLCDRARIRLTALIRGIPHTDMIGTDAENETEADEIENNSDFKCDELLNSTEDVPSNTWECTKQIYDACVVQISNESSSDSGNVNGFCNAKFAKHLKNLLPYFPLFSEIMRVACGRGSKNATSAAVESEFNDLKSRVLRNVRLPLRADRFIASHVSSFPGKIKLVLAGQREKDALLELKKRERDRVECQNGGDRLKTNECTKESDDDPVGNDNLPETFEGKPPSPNNSTNHWNYGNFDSMPESTNYHDLNPQVPTMHDNHYEDVHIEELDPVEKPVGYGELKSVPLDSACANEDCGPGMRIINVRKKRRLDLANADRMIESVNESLIELREEHNWRNKNKSTKRQGYTKACPNFDPSNIEKYTSLPVLPNGNHCKSISIKSNTIIVENTCGFDSACQIIAMAVCNNALYRSRVEGQTGIYTCIDILIKKGIVAQVYKERATILRALPNLRQEVKGHIIRIVADSSITSMIEGLFIDVPSCVVRHNCAKCGVETRHPRVFVDVNYNPLTSQGIKALDQALALGRYDPPQCCGLLGTTTTEYGPHLFLDVDTGRSSRDAICDVPTNLTVDNTQYKLAGVIEYQGPNRINSVGHYIAYCWTGNNWLKYNDNARKTTSPVVCSKTMMEIHACVYTI